MFLQVYGPSDFRSSWSDLSCDFQDSSVLPDLGVVVVCLKALVLWWIQEKLLVFKLFNFFLMWWQLCWLSSSSYAGADTVRCLMAFNYWYDWIWAYQSIVLSCPSFFFFFLRFYLLEHFQVHNQTEQTVQRFLIYPLSSHKHSLFYYQHPQPEWYIC